MDLTDSKSLDKVVRQEQSPDDFDLLTGLLVVVLPLMVVVVVLLMMVEGVMVVGMG